MKTLLACLLLLAAQIAPAADTQTIRLMNLSARIGSEPLTVQLQKILQKNSTFNSDCLITQAQVVGDKSGTPVRLLLAAGKSGGLFAAGKRVFMSVNEGDITRRLGILGGRPVLAYESFSSTGRGESQLLRVAVDSDLRLVRFYAKTITRSSLMEQKTVLLTNVVQCGR